VSKRKTKTSGRRPRRSFTDEFKAGAVRLVLEEGKSVTQVARDLDLTASALRIWVDRAKADRGQGRPGVLTTEERQELARLRKEVRTLRQERDILKKATALFAQENK
jgi:transposase